MFVVVYFVNFDLDFFNVCCKFVVFVFILCYNIDQRFSNFFKIFNEFFVVFGEGEKCLYNFSIGR